MSHASSRPIPGTLRGPAKLSAVKSLLKKLTLDLEQSNLLPDERDTALEELKIYGRDPSHADPIFTQEGVETLTRHAFDSSSDTTSRNALRCLANAMLLRSGTRQMFVNLHRESEACKMLGNDSWDDEFLVSRVLLLTTYDTNIDLTEMINQHGLADTITKKLARHAELVTKSPTKVKEDPMVDMALTETAKVLFNVVHFRPEQRSSFTRGIPHILTMLCNRPLPAGKVLDPPFGPLVNALADHDLKDEAIQSSLYPEASPTETTERLISILDLSLKQYSDSEMDATVTPVVGVLAMIYESAPEGVRQFIRQKLLPTEDDRQQVLGRGDSLPSRLLRSSTNPLTPKLRDAISHLLFYLSDRDAQKFVENVGYGFASGYLFQNKIPVPPEAVSANANSSRAEGSSSRAVNPVTGQFLDAEKFAEMPPMTDEEKEREAEKLFVLFERLKRTGIVEVQNPVEKAFHEGRFEELPDDAEEDETESSAKGKELANR